MLIDEIRGRATAIARNIATVRTAAVLFEAANAGVIDDLKLAYDKLSATNFRVPSQALDKLLRRHLLLKLRRGQT